mmetsp:Transcript_15180/g.57239  ORF Transcript_15180/g.57239 Transcript_15180/m.57239 type:complete len:223 (-) Transcript_15180:2204-2872(-)
MWAASRPCSAPTTRTQRLGGLDPRTRPWKTASAGRLAGPFCRRPRVMSNSRPRSRPQGPGAPPRGRETPLGPMRGMLQPRTASRPRLGLSGTGQRCGCGGWTTETTSRRALGASGTLPSRGGCGRQACRGCPFAARLEAWPCSERLRWQRVSGQGTVPPMGASMPGCARQWRCTASGGSLLCRRWCSCTTCEGAAGRGSAGLPTRRPTLPGQGPRAGQRAVA